jgi:hypothetical protein
MPGFQNISKDKIIIISVVIVVVGIILVLGNNYVKKMIKKELLRDKKKRKYLEKKNRMNNVSIPIRESQREIEDVPEEDADMDSYINPIGIDPSNGDNYANYQQVEENEEEKRDDKRFNKNDIMQRDMMENARN